MAKCEIYYIFNCCKCSIAITPVGAVNIEGEYKAMMSLKEQGWRVDPVSSEESLLCYKCKEASNV